MAGSKSTSFAPCALAWYMARSARWSSSCTACCVLWNMAMPMLGVLCIRPLKVIGLVE